MAQSEWRVEDCPLPEVAEALKPFIKPREEVAAIRQGLQSYLQKQLHEDGTPLCSVHLTSIPARELLSPPAGLSGVRKAYWQALQAHTTAQAKYDDLRVELEELKRPKVSSQSSAGYGGSDSINETYIPLLRQQERYRKLMVLEKAFIDINLAGGDVGTTSADESVKKAVGDLPTPPSTQPSSHRNPEVEAKIAELKKAVVSTKRKVDERNAKTSFVGANAVGALSRQAEIAGLQAALQTLTIWMEDQLTVIASAEAEVHAEPNAPAKCSKTIKAPPCTEDIEALYEQYLEARQRFVETVNSPPADAPDPDTTELADVSGGPKDTNLRPPSKSAAEAILPYLPTLLELKQEEQSLVQQNSYTRHQLSAAEAENERLFHRLADESHLVQPGASNGSDWADAAKTAGAATEKYTNERLVGGEASAHSARDALKGIREVPGSMDRLLEKA